MCAIYNILYLLYIQALCDAPGQLYRAFDFLMPAEHELAIQTTEGEQDKHQMQNSNDENEIDAVIIGTMDSKPMEMGTNVNIYRKC